MSIMALRFNSVNRGADLKFGVKQAILAQMVFSEGVHAVDAVGEEEQAEDGPVLSEEVHRGKSLMHLPTTFLNCPPVYSSGKSHMGLLMELTQETKSP